MRYQQFCLGHSLLLCVRVRGRYCVCVCVCMCLHYLADPLLHFEPFPSSMFLSGERGNDTFVALNKLRGSSHAVSTGSGSRGSEGGGGCGGEGGGGAHGGGTL